MLPLVATSPAPNMAMPPPIIIAWVSDIPNCVVLVATADALFPKKPQTAIAPPPPIIPNPIASVPFAIIIFFAASVFNLFVNQYQVYILFLTNNICEL